MRASDLIFGVDDRGCARCAINLDTWVNGNQCSLASCKEELDFEIFKQLNIQPIFTQNTNGTNIRASKCMHVSLLQLKICHVIDRCRNSCATLYCERMRKNQQKTMFRRHSKFNVHHRLAPVEIWYRFLILKWDDVSLVMSYPRRSATHCQAKGFNVLFLMLQNVAGQCRRTYTIVHNCTQTNTQTLVKLWTGLELNNRIAPSFFRVQQVILR